jgi:putative spermidine/putrescine transport system substrate-binding protein
LKLGRLGVLLTVTAVLASACTSGGGTETSQSPGGQGSIEGSRVVFWNTAGGDWNDAVGEAIVTPFQKETGAEVLFAYFCCGLTKLKSMVESGNVVWDVAEASSDGEYLQGINENLYQKIDLSLLPLDNLDSGSVEEVGIQQASYGAYGVKYARYAAGLAWNTDVYPSSGQHPTSYADLFDTTKFPGKRCFGDYAEYEGTLEAALLADGVAPDQLYPLDVARALKKLDTIKSQIVWWSSGAEAAQLLIDGECDLGMSYNGRVYARVKEEGAPLAFSWQNAVVADSWLTIPRGASNYDGAMALIAYFLDPARDAAKDEIVPYPAPLKHVYGNLSDLAKQFVTAGPNLATAITEDATYYSENIDQVQQEFETWKDG